MILYCLVINLNTIFFSYREYPTRDYKIILKYSKCVRYFSERSSACFGAHKKKATSIEIAFDI